MNPLEKTTLGGGCYWCTEAIFQRLKGVEKIESGFSGGHVAHPNYTEVCSGNTGHAEVVQITFDPTVISFSDLLEIFFEIHDPTTLNRQGNDVGNQYRSVIFFHSEEQKHIAEIIKQKIGSSGKWPAPLVTEISPYQHFFKAENAHQNYFNQHGKQPYCQIVIAPKVQKFIQKFSEKLRDLSVDNR